MPITPPQTLTVSSHGLVIRANNTSIGAIHNWRPNMTRGAAHVYEFGSVVGPDSASGEPYEVVPGNVTGLEISIGRYDIYTNRFERAFSSQDLVMLTAQTVPIQFVEIQNAPSSVSPAQESMAYEGCWFTRLGRTYDTTGNRIVMVDAAAAYTRKHRVS